MSFPNGALLFPRDVFFFYRAINRQPSGGWYVGMAVVGVVVVLVVVVVVVVVVVGKWNN